MSDNPIWFKGLTRDEWIDYWGGGDWKADGLTREEMAKDLAHAASELKHMGAFIGDQMLRSDFQSCYHMRLEIERLKEMVADAITVLKEREPLWATELQDRLGQVP